MFYNQEYFARRKGGLGIYWLAATLGSSSTFKKLSKKEIMDCNIPRAVDKLIHPEEPLALRLTSNLMFGVTRIYSYQCNYLHQHATTTSTSLKHAIVQFDMPRANKDTIAALTLTHEGATSSNEKAGNGNAKGALKHVRDGGVRITIVRDDAMDLLADLGEMFNDGRLDYTWEGLREQLNTSTSGAKRKRIGHQGSPSSSGLLDEEGEFVDELEAFDEDEYIDQGSRKKAKTKDKAAPAEKAPAASRRTTTMGRLEDINLPAHLMDEQQFGDDLRDDERIFGEDREFDPMFDLDPDFDLGLADLPPPLADLDNNEARRQPRGSSLTVAGELGMGGTYGGPDTSATGPGGFEPGFDGDGFGDGFFDGPAVDFELGLDGPDVGGQDAFYEGARDRSREDRIGNFDMNEVLGNEQKEDDGANARGAGLPTPPPSDGVVADLSNGENGHGNASDNATPASKKPRSKKVLQPVRDKFTTLHADEITKNREAYSDEMKKVNLRKDLERFEKGEKERVLDMMTSLPFGIKEPVFERFFSQALTLNELLRSTTNGRKVLSKDLTNKRKASTVIDPSLPDEDRSVTTHARGLREGSVLSSQMGRNAFESARQSDYGFNDGLDPNLDGDAIFHDVDRGDDYQFDAFPDGQNGDWPNDYERPPSVARSFSLGPRRERGSSIHAEESNIGRERAASISYGHGSQMPWNISYSSAAGFGNVPSSSARYSVGRGSVPPTPGGPRSRSSSVLGTSLLRGRAPSRADSPFPADNNSIYERGQTPSRAETPGKYRQSPAPSVSVGGREGSVISEHIFSDSQIGETESQIEVRLEAESRNFYRFAKGFAQTPTHDFLLSDIIPVAPTAPIVAAQAFYHTLMLASKGLFKVHQQEEAYGEIRLSIPNAFQSSQSQTPAIRA